MSCSIRVFYSEDDYHTLVESAGAVNNNPIQEYTRPGLYQTRLTWTIVFHLLVLKPYCLHSEITKMHKRVDRTDTSLGQVSEL